MIVPKPLRMLTYRACRWKPLGATARYLHNVAATSIGQSLKSLPKTKSVYLTGGSVHRVVPALSDIDLMVVTEITTDSILRLRGRARSLKALYWMLGEILVLDQRTLKHLQGSGSALSIHLFGDKKLLAGTDVQLLPATPSDPKSLFMLMMRFYAKATDVAASASRMSSYDDADCKRYLSKIVALNNGTKVTGYRLIDDGASLESYFGDAYNVLDQRASRILTDLFPGGVPAVVNQIAIQSAETTSQSNPLRLSESAKICRFMGLTLESLTPTLNRLTSIPEDISTLVLKHSIRERALRRYFQLPGDMTLNSREAIRSKLNQFCRLGCYLATNQYFVDRSVLANKSREHLPVTALTMEKTHQDSPELSLETLIEASLNVRHELEKILIHP